MLRTVALIEGASFLMLLFVAMPLKYFAGMPMAVKVVGWIHGALFVVVVAVLVWTMIAARWPITRGALVFVAALVPFGPFVIDRRMKGYADDFEARGGAGGGDERAKRLTSS